MNKIILIISIFLLSTTTLFSQSRKTKNLLKEIETEWSLDDNGNVTYVHVVDAHTLSKVEIYSRVLNYFVYNYNSGKSVIQTQDEELGRIIGKGLYDDVHIGVSILTTYIDCWHIARVDVQEGRARIILTLNEYEKKVVGGDSGPSYFTTKVRDEFPITPKSYTKTVMGKAFYKSHKAAKATLQNIERSIKEGNTSKEIENDNW
jgi:hypothetical protein